MATPQEYAKDIHPKAIAICRALKSHDGEASTPQITDHTEYPNDALNYWFKNLMRDGVIERTGERDESTSIPAHVYRLTDFGEEIIEESRGREEKLEDRIIALESRDDTVEMLANSNRDLRERMDELEDQVDKMRILIKSLKDGMA